MIPDVAVSAVTADTHPAVRHVLTGLDEEQLAAVTAPAGPVCILAGAGTGKTRAITHRIAYRVLTGQVAAKHVLAVTFTARAAGQMRGRLAALGVRGVSARTFHAAALRQVAAEHVLAVTFTARAAGQMRSRLAALGVRGVSARTFHAAALRQVRYFAPRLLSGRAMPELVESKARLVTLAAARAGVRTDRTAARDLAGEIEWAKSSLVEPDEYEVAASKAGRETPLPPASVAAVFTAYERIKRAAGAMDFEDLLRAAVWAIEEHSDVAEQVRAQYRHFVVDEYQDVNPVQQRLLESWLGGRQDLTVVGDASQTIYSFTGASCTHLIDFPRRHRDGVVIRLIRDYRSTPQVVGFANAIIRQARGPEARLRLELVGQRPSGPEPDIRTFTDEPAEAEAVAKRCTELIGSGLPAKEIAVLFRTNAQSEAYEEALAEVGVAYVVQGAERFFERAEVRQAMVALRAATRTTPPGTPLHEAVCAALEAVGWRPDEPPPGGAARERWEALAALVTLADEVASTVLSAASSATSVASPPDAGDEPADLTEDGASPGTTLEEFCAELSRRATLQHVPTMDGVTLASLHSAKGLEWDAVFVVGLVEGTLPTGYAKTAEALEEERRLLYVGITRARQWLWLSYSSARSPGGRARKPSRFLPVPESARAAGPGRDRAGSGGRSRAAVAIISCRVCGITLLSGSERKLGRCASCPSDIDEELYERLHEWRRRVASAAKVPAYVVFTDATLTAIAERRPGRTEDLVQIAGIGPRKLGLYGDAVLALVSGVRVEDAADLTGSVSGPEKSQQQVR